MRDLLAYVAIIVISAAVVFGTPVLAHVLAAPAAKAIDPGCYPFSTVGIVIIMRCVDDDGNVFFANSAGYMMPVGN